MHLNVFMNVPAYVVTYRYVKACVQCNAMLSYVMLCYVMICKVVKRCVLLYTVVVCNVV